MSDATTRRRSLGVRPRTRTSTSSGSDPHTYTSPRRWPWVAVIVVGVALMAGGCGCDVDCGAATTDPLVIAGTLTDLDDGRATVDLADGTSRVVHVSGRAWALETGRSYRFPAFEADDGRLVATMPGGCTCGPSVTDADGDPVDVSAWSWLERRLEAAVTIAAITFGSVIVLWGLVRVVARLLEDRAALR